MHACKLAWDKLQSWCKAHTDDKDKEACEKYRADPKDFLVRRVLRATVNPIDAGYRCDAYSTLVLLSIWDKLAATFLGMSTCPTWCYS